MAYCKTKTYINLKRIADRAYNRYVNDPTKENEEIFAEYEMEVSLYALEFEDQIDWEKAING